MDKTLGLLTLVALLIWIAASVLRLRARRAVVNALPRMVSDHPVMRPAIANINTETVRGHIRAQPRSTWLWSIGMLIFFAGLRISEFSIWQIVLVASGISIYSAGIGAMRLWEARRQRGEITGEGPPTKRSVIWSLYLGLFDAAAAGGWFIALALSASLAVDAIGAGPS